MDICTINIPAAGTWSRDCELISLINQSGLILNYHKDSDDSYWILRCHIVPAYKVTGEEFSRTGYLGNLPLDGSFFEILNSPWMIEISEYQTKVPGNCRHCVFRFYDQTIEILAVEFNFEKIS